MAVYFNKTEKNITTVSNMTFKTHTFKSNLFLLYIYFVIGLQ